MDPVTAFGLAVNILTVIDLSAKILSKAAEIRSKGSGISVSDNRIVTQSLDSCCTKLIEWKEKSKIAPDAADSENTVLGELAQEAINIAKDIQESLPKIRDEATLWESLHDAVLDVWGSGKLEEKMKRLEMMRNQLQFQIIVSMKAKIDLLTLKEHTASQNLDDQTRRLIEAILAGEEATRSELDTHVLVLQKKLGAHDDLVVQQHAEVMNAVRSISARPQDVIERANHPAVTRRIIDSLWFTRMSDRYEDIKPSFQNTFEWIFSEGNGAVSSSCTFMEWISSGSGVYWVSGKAGSGKSTLMKYISQSDRTVQALQEWAGDRQLIMADHWFYDQGTNTLQKSLSGLLRSILRDVIQGNAEYAPLLFPDQFVTGRGFADFPTLNQLKNAFGRLLTIGLPHVCVGLLIDGLDEYSATEREHFEIAEEFKSTSLSSHVKIIVSSRPEVAFETTFTDCSKLRLHDLTLSDRTLYVANRLNSHRRIGYLMEQDPKKQGAVQSLIESTVEKSEGIFLWVRLVIDSLLEELNQCDTLLALQAILNKFPSGLENLFLHMLGRIPQDRRRSGFQLLQVVRRNLDTVEMRSKWVENGMEAVNDNITAVCLSVAHVDISTVIDLKIAVLNETDMQDIIHKVDHRLRKNCAGLLELLESNSATNGETAGSDPDPCVKFVHRSVAEFLDQQRSVDSEFLNALTDTAFDTDISLISGFLMMLKRSPVCRISYAHRWDYIERIMHLARKCEVSNPGQVEALLDELDHTMLQLSIVQCAGKSSIWATEVLRKSPGTWVNTFPWDIQHLGRDMGVYIDDESKERETLTHGSFLSFAVANGLANYAITKIRRSKALLESTEGRPLLASACNPHPMVILTPGVIRPKLVVELLKLGADPNQRYGPGKGRTPWMDMLHSLDYMRIVSVQGADQLAQILEAFLNNGASLDPLNKEKFSYPKDRSIRATKQIQWYFGTTRGYVNNDRQHLTPFVPFEELGLSWASFSPWGLSFEEFSLSPAELETIDSLGKKLLALVESRSHASPQRDSTRSLPKAIPWTIRLQKKWSNAANRLRRVRD